MSSFVVSLLVLSIALFGAAAALSCYENDNTGSVVVRTDPAFKFCSMIPGALDGHVGRQSGVSSLMESLEPMAKTFGQNNKLYEVKVLCLLESYRFFEINPAFGSTPEHMFRCFCATDLCNENTTFAAFLNDNRH